MPACTHPTISYYYLSLLMLPLASEDAGNHFCHRSSHQRQLSPQAQALLLWLWHFQEPLGWFFSSWHWLRGIYQTLLQFMCFEKLKVSKSRQVPGNPCRSYRYRLPAVADWMGTGSLVYYIQPRICRMSAKAILLAGLYSIYIAAARSWF